MSFATAIQNTPLLKNSLKNGLQALGSDSHKIKQLIAENVKAALILILPSNLFIPMILVGIMPWDTTK